MANAAPSTMDTVVHEIAQLTEALKSVSVVTPQHEQTFAALHKQMTDLQAQIAADNAPTRRVPGALVGPSGEPIQRSNRYYRMLADFERDGKHKSGGQTLKPVDLFLTSLALEKAHAADRTSVAPSADLIAAVKALTSTGTGAGAELVPSDLAQTLWDDFFLASMVAGLFMQVPMPSNPFDIPQSLGALVWRKGTQNVATTGSDANTSKSTLTATELLTEQSWSYTLQEDAIAALMPGLRSRLGQSGAEIIDSFLLNADATVAATGNINSDDAQIADDHFGVSDGQDGLRHQWLVDNVLQQVNAGGALTDAHITSVLALLGKYAADPTKLAFITDISTYLKGFLATGTGTPGENTITIDKFGTGALVLTGQLAAYRGVPIVISASHPLAEADGKVSATAANNTKGSITVAHRSMWYTGFMRELLIEIDRIIQRRQYVMVTSVRPAIAAFGTRATNTHTAGIRNITV